MVRKLFFEIQNNALQDQSKLCAGSETCLSSSSWPKERIKGPDRITPCQFFQQAQNRCENGMGKTDCVKELCDRAVCVKELCVKVLCVTRKGCV